MFTTIGIGVVLFIVILAVLFIGRRIFRIAMKLAIVGVLLLLLITGGVYAWWQGWFSSNTRATHPAPANQRANSNRRPSR